MSSINDGILDEMHEYNQGVSAKNLTVRDILAINRTVLANERTFLAYLRTSATLLIAGISLIKLFESLFAQISGITLIICAIVVVIYGMIKYDSMKQLILEEKNVHHAEDISGDYMYVPKLMWELVHRAYSKLILHEK